MSALSKDVRHGLGIARVELRRSVRKSFGTRKRQLTVLGFVALFSPLLFFWGQIAYTAGREAAREGTVPLDVLGVQLSLLVLVFVVMGALRVVQQGRPEGDSLLLTATTPRAVLVGLTVHSAIQLVGFVLFPTLLFAGGFALGAEMPSILLTTVVAVIPLFTAVTVSGTVVGQLVVLGLLESGVLRKASRVFGVVLLLVLMALSYAAMAPVMGAGESLAPLAVVALPAIEYLAFVFVGTPLGPPLDVGSVVVGASVVASIPALFVVATRLAPRLWFADATPTGLIQRDALPTGVVSRPSDDDSTKHHGQAFPPRTRPRPLSIALGLWIRWLRIPVRFSVLFPLVIVLATALFGAVNDPEQVPLVVGGVLVFAGVYVSGAAFGLNPLGEAGEMRTVEFLSSTTSRTLVLGHLLAGLIVGTPIAVVGTVILSVAADLSVPVALAVGLLAVVLTVTSGCVAVAIGSVLPSRDAQRTYRGYEVATPSQWALVVYMVTAVFLSVIAGIGAFLVLLSTDPGTSAPLFVVASGVAVLVLLAVGYAGFRTAVTRFGAPPYERGEDQSEDSRRGTPNAEDTDESALGRAGTPTFTPTQEVRGLVLLGAFVVLRAVAARAWARYFPGGYSTDPVFLGFLGGIFLVLSVGLVYLGFTRWVGVDLRAWWFDRRQLGGDLGWGVVGIVLVLVATVGGVLALTLVFPGLTPVEEAGAAPSPTVTGEAVAGFGVNLLLGWFFGFAIAAFQEETLFRGFLQGLLQDRYGRSVAIVGQATIFTLAHLGYYPVSAWPLLLVVFLVGLVTGWLVDRRGTLLPAGIAHGFVG
ncbi:CPBP family intramembrane glutamic endopeptidase [Halogeometricum sp. CBA1124]|uniref:CPBP family intramembrane glutamic endopeptidase n=1 Tax=Halogeometricum sp. CBA1124 TaxID=2668071 RepID=UPI00142B8C0E|nr:type II CAAX endopeptidase family protein [Halogeometricum sp. CBA1124]MUV56563.1 CPBP family intramembrane metalloprotease [Halogeometricum sp. CBA1124]